MKTDTFTHTESGLLRNGIPVSGAEKQSGSEIKLCPYVSWCYLFVHNRKVKTIEDRLKVDHMPHFVHKSIRYMPRSRKGGGVKQTMVPSVSGLIFLQGEAKSLQSYLDERFPNYRLCKNCSTGQVAVIPDSQMQPFMRVAEVDPDRVRFLLRPFLYYAKNHTLIRITSGDMAGLEGYVVRIARDRRLVMEVGGMSIAVSGMHAEQYVEVDKNQTSRKECERYYKRQLNERNAFIDRYFHQVGSLQEAQEQAANIDLLRTQTLSDMQQGTLNIVEAFATYHFIIEEIAYYYAPIFDTLTHQLAPVLEAGRKVLQGINHLLTLLPEGNDVRLNHESAYEELNTHYGYLFE